MSKIQDAIDLLSLKTGGAITTIDQLTSLMTDGGAVAVETIYQHKEVRVAGAAGSAAIAAMPISLWQYEGTPQPHGAVPTAWANPSNTTVGGLLQASPGGGRTKYLLSLIASVQTGGMLVLCDRLGANGGLDGTATTAQNVNGGSAAATTRNTGGVGNFLFAEVYTAIGATATTITASYTNDQGVAGQTTQPVVIGGTNRLEAQRLIQLSLAQGDVGVQAVTSVTLAATTGTPGNFGVTILRPLVAAPITTVGSCAVIKNFLNAPVPTFDSTACLTLMFIPITTAAPVLDLIVNSVEV